MAKTIRVIVFIFWIPVTVLATPDGYTMMGAVTSTTRDGHTVTFMCDKGVVKLSFLKDNILRVHMSPDGQFPKDDLHLNQNGPYAVVRYDWSGVEIHISEAFDAELEGEIYRLVAGEFIVKVRKRPFKLAFFDAQENLLVMEQPGVVHAGLGYRDSLVIETMHLPDDEHFFGFGAHRNPLDMRGREMVCSATELQGPDHDGGGFPTPWFMSTRGYAIFFNNLDDDVTFRMGTTPGEFSFQAPNGRMEGWDMDYYLIHGPGFDRLAQSYYEITGHPILPEKWYFGHMQSECCEWNAAEMIEVAQTFRRLDFPCDVLIIDSQALGKDFRWNPVFEHVQTMYAELDRLGFKTAINTALHKPIYDWKKYDPTVQESLADYWQLHVPLVEAGNDFWWQDNAERFFRFSGTFKFANGYELHNLFGSLWAQNVLHGMAAMGLQGRPVLSRGGSIGGHRTIIPWPGDTWHGLQYLKPDLDYIRNGGLSGYPYVTVDYGGFHKGTGQPLEEQNVIRRMINLLPIMPISRAHGVGDGAMFPWKLTEAQQDLFRYYLKLRYHLHPYIYSTAIKSHLTGRPMLAALVFDYQNDANTYDKDYDFLFGEQFLAAPVVEKAESREVYLPRGEWIHYWSGEEFTGGKSVKIAAPLYGHDGLPLFVKAGAIIPMMPEMSYIYEKPLDTLTLDVYPLASGSSRYDMLDCSTPEAPIDTLRLECESSPQRIELAIGPSDFDYELWVHTGRPPVSVLVDGETLPELEDAASFESVPAGWYYGTGRFYGSERLATLNIKFPGGSGPHRIEIAKRPVRVQKIPPSLEASAKEPVRYIGALRSDKHFYDGRLPHAVGVHQIQVYRANRANPPEGGVVGWTYSHAPMLAYWNGTFYLQYLSNLKEEHHPPSRTMLMTSEDGYDWTTPRVLFPIYPLPEIKKGDVTIEEGTPAVAHQRMGFYVAPNGRLLTVSFISYAPTPRDSPNRGQGLGRLVREIYQDGSFGPIYFIRYNRHAGWNEQNVPHYPFYKKSEDARFVAACDALLADKLMTLQWWEMDRSRDGFYALDPGEYEIKALSFYHRLDGVVVGLWKHNLAALSPDDGHTWTPIAKYPSLKTCAAKVWGQRTDDGRYALVYDESATRRNRFPLVIITGDDGSVFDDMLCVDGEVPPMRYQGIHKNIGPQYIRGIAEGNGNPPGDHLWVTYSVNKEDIWVTRIRVPVTRAAEKQVKQDFENVGEVADLALWNLYMPSWARISAVTDPFDRSNRCLRLRDEEPYDYARAERIFPESKHIIVKLRVLQQQVGHGLLEIEVQGRHGERPMRLRFDSEWLMFDRGKGEPRPLRFDVGRWHTITLKLDCETQSYDVVVDGVQVKKQLAFAEPVESLQRLVFRTGPWRGDVRPFIVDGEPGNPGLYEEDLPGAGHKVPASVFLIDDVETR